jgi:ankyrin repeat protein
MSVNTEDIDIIKIRYLLQLMSAIQQNDKDLFNKILANKPRFSAEHFQNHLIYAKELGYEHFITPLCQMGADETDMNAQNREITERCNAMLRQPGSLIKAIQENNQFAFDKILKLKTNTKGEEFIDEVDPHFRRTPLVWAARLGHAHFIDPLLKAGANINKDSRLAVFLAVLYGHAAVITALENAGADAVTQPERSLINAEDKRYTVNDLLDDLAKRKNAVDEVYDREDPVMWAQLPRPEASIRMPCTTSALVNHSLPCSSCLSI